MVEVHQNEATKMFNSTLTYTRIAMLVAFVLGGTAPAAWAGQEEDAYANAQVACLQSANAEASAGARMLAYQTCMHHLGYTCDRQRMYDNLQFNGPELGSRTDCRE